MFGLGTWEILLILVAALIFIGPSKLPDMARSLGKGMREVRRAMAGFETEVRRAVEDDEEPRKPPAPGLPAGAEVETTRPAPTAAAPPPRGDAPAAGGDAAAAGGDAPAEGAGDPLGRVSAAPPAAEAWHKAPEPGDGPPPEPSDRGGSAS